MKKQLITITICLILGIILGFLNTVFIYEGFWQHLNNGLNTVSFWVHLIYAFISLFLVVLAHEMGHFISFKKQGIKPKAIYVLGLALVDDHGWKIRFVPKFLWLVGGIVIPEHLSITNEEEETMMVEKFKRVLLAGPKASIIYGVTIMVIWILCLFTNVYWLSGFLFTMMIVTTIMTVLAILSSKISRSGMYGDFAAKNAFDKDPLFRLTYLIQLTTLIEHDTLSIDYFWPKIVETLEKNNQVRHPLYLNLLGQYIYEVVFLGRIACLGVEKKFLKLVNQAPKNEDSLIMYLNIIYYYEAMNNKAKVLDLLNKLDTSKIKMDKKILTYFLHLTNHLLKFKDESQFLDDDKNIHTSSLSWVYKPLNLKEDIKGIKK